MVSHELRAPLTSIRGSADTLMEGQEDLDPAEMRQFHRIIREQADQMQRLITDLLDVARIDAGALTLHPEPCDVAALVERARSTFQSGSARHDIQIGLAADLPRVTADRRRIVQVLGNLPVQRGAALAGRDGHPGGGGTAGCPCGTRGVRRRRGNIGGAVAPAVSPVLHSRRWGAG